jgi:L-cysteine:1D-myo-inositol 2-amino-2-deoxy-alpha-D-glucopyranoside ligase
LYSCGITPYDSAHLGHAAVYLYFDMLQQRLQDAGHETRCAHNVTDVDDDILRKSRELGVHYLSRHRQHFVDQRSQATKQADGTLGTFI